jgi:hypothetical protein
MIKLNKKINDDNKKRMNIGFFECQACPCKKLQRFRLFSTHLFQAAVWQRGRKIDSL